MLFLDIVVALVVVVLMAAAADVASGRRGMIKHLLVSGAGAASGAFLGVRVFQLAAFDGWVWVGWSVAGAAIALVIFLLTRSKR